MESLSSKTYYQLLGLAPEATTEEIKQAYKELARVYHPDSRFFDDLLASAKGTSKPVETEDKFKIITNAYNILSDPKARAAYDAILPKNLKSWGDDQIPSGDDGARFEVNFVIPERKPKVAKSAAYGVFGSQPIAAVESGPEELNMQSVESSGLLSKLAKALGLA